MSLSDENAKRQEEERQARLEAKKADMEIADHVLDRMEKLFITMMQAGMQAQQQHNNFILDLVKTGGQLTAYGARAVATDGESLHDPKHELNKEPKLSVPEAITSLVPQTKEADLVVPTASMGPTKKI